MSLDVWLTGPEETVECICPHCDHAHTRVRAETLYESNITHNLGRMADAAGIYHACWRPEELGITTAKELIPFLRGGLNRLLADPEHFKQFNASNGWGLYEYFVPWVQNYLYACERYPDAEVHVSR